ncbi:MAG: PQQ-binding-like beta-propeller repeat protein [Pirellulales bacterium]
MRHGFLTICALLGLARIVAAADAWPQFRGPGGQGHAAADRLPLTWSETSNITWKVALPGRGWSSPVVEGRQIWLTTALEGGTSLRAMCLDLSTGSVVHDVEVFRPDNPPAINDKNSYASPTPVLESGRLYAHFGTLGTACLDTRSGKVLWTNNELELDHKEGPGSSPVSWGKLLVIHCDGMDVQYVAALDKRSGRIAWKTNRSGKMSDNPDFRKAYSTPLVVSIDGKDQLVSPGAGRVFSYDPATGRELWSVDYPGFSNVPRPVYGGGLVFVCTGYMKPELWAIHPHGRGDVTSTHVAWRTSRQVPANSSPLWVAGRIYMTSDGGVASCLAAEDGRLLWQTRLGGNYTASPLHAAGRIYFFSEEGASTVLEPGTEPTELAKNRLDGRILASPAVAGNALLVRTEKHLYRIEEPPGGAASAGE